MVLTHIDLSDKTQALHRQRPRAQVQILCTGVRTIIPLSSFAPASVSGPEGDHSWRCHQRLSILYLTQGAMRCPTMTPN